MFESLEEKHLNDAEIKTTHVGQVESSCAATSSTAHVNQIKSSCVVTSSTAHVSLVEIQPLTPEELEKLKQTHQEQAKLMTDDELQYNSEETTEKATEEEEEEVLDDSLFDLRGVVEDDHEEPK